MKIAELLATQVREVITVPVRTPVSDVVRMLSRERIGAVPVVDGEQVVGIMSERDVIVCLAEAGGGTLEVAVEKAMTSPPVTVTPEMTILGGLALMTHRRIRHLVVIREGAMVGFVSIGDLVKARIDVIESEAAAMRDYIQGA